MVVPLVNLKELPPFMDVLLMDATYQTNRFKCPAVIITCIDFENKSRLVCCAIIQDENSESYAWVLNNMMDMYGGRAEFAQHKVMSSKFEQLLLVR